MLAVLLLLAAALAVLLVLLILLAAALPVLLILLAAALPVLALLLIASLWLLPPDRSGLPIQWLLYWPLALILQIVIGGATAIILSARERKRERTAA